MTNRERYSSTGVLGEGGALGDEHWLSFPSRDDPLYDVAFVRLRAIRSATDRAAARQPGQGLGLLLAVELDDQLLLDRVSMTCAGREAWTRMRIRLGMTSSHAGTVRSPASARAMTNGVSSSEFGADLDDVVLAHAVARDVDLVAVDRDVAVADELAGHVARLGEAGAVDDVVETATRGCAAGSRRSCPGDGWPPRSSRGTASRGRRRCARTSASRASAAGTRCPWCGRGRAHPAGRDGSRSGTSADSHLAPLRKSFIFSRRQRLQSGPV